MNRSFKHIADYVKQNDIVLDHRQRVTRLYRHSLKLMASWVIDRRTIIEDSRKIRARFDALKDEPADSAKVSYAIRAGEKELEDYVHVDPYVLPYMPGGSKFMRNPPPPPSAAYEGHPSPDAYTGTNTPVYPDMIPITFRKKHVATLVDFSKKTYE